MIEWASYDQARLLEEELDRWRSYLFFWIALIVYGCTIVLHNEADLHEHTLQAYAWLHGTTNVDWAPFIHEKALWKGHYYILHPPLPTIVDLPFVALWGPWFPQSVVSVIVGAVCVMLVYRLTKNSWLTIFFGFGTVFWYEASLGAVWGFCAVLSCLPTLMALLEVEKGESAWKTGFWAGVAALARYDLVAAWPVYLLLWDSNHSLTFRRRKYAIDTGPYPPHHEPGSAIAMLPGFVFALGVYAIYCYLRYGVPYDLGLGLWYNVEPAGRAAHPGLGPFSLSYLPFNLYTALFMAPAFVPHFPWVVPTPMGQCILLTSPALLVALAAPWDKKTALLWSAVLLSMSGCLLVWSNGVEQFGYRYLIQVLPFLVLLMSRVRESPDRVTRTLVLVSLCLTTWGLAVIRLWGWP